MADYIERQITTAAILNTDYLRQIEEFYKPQYIEANSARKILEWCFSYYRKYKKAPGKHIQNIYVHKLKNKQIDKKTAQVVELVLENLSQNEEVTNVGYLVDQTKEYFKQRSLLILSEDIQNELEQGNIIDAEAIALSYKPPTELIKNDIDPFTKQVKPIIRKAFEERKNPLIRFPGALGKFWNHELVRGGFVALMGHEKIGKTFLLIEMAMRAIRSKAKVAFFQAGDMTEAQQARRIAIYLNKRSDQERYCRGMFVPKLDCWLNQCDECDRDERESDELIFKKKKDITYNSLVEAVAKYPDYRPCHNCRNIIGSVWLEWRKPIQPLTAKHAYKSLITFGRRYKGRLRISTHANEELTITKVERILEQWEKSIDFIPDVVIIDYADILAPCRDIYRLEFRQQQNKIWQRMRALSEKKQVLLLTATQAKATSYNKKLLDLSDYSEDKRKYAHTTAMYGLNQLPDEKRIGLLRINELVIRESDFDRERPVTVLQRLQMGRPFIGSYR